MAHADHARSSKRSLRAGTTSRTSSYRIAAEKQLSRSADPDGTVEPKGPVFTGENAERVLAVQRRAELRLAESARRRAMPEE